MLKKASYLHKKKKNKIRIMLKIKTFIILIIIVIIGYVTPFCFAQNMTVNQTDSTLKANRKEVLNFFVYGENILQKYGAKAAVDSLLQFESIYANAKDFGRKGFYYQVLMTYYAFFDYKKSLEYEYLAFNKKEGTKHNFTPQTEFVDAKKYLLKKFGSEKIIMFNEAHNCSQNRAFIRDLLSDFHKKGFDYLAIEALSHSDTLINNRKYPIQTSGTYINDPVFGQLIREALTIGMKVIPYDDTTSHKSDSYIVGANKREQVQAENIFKLLKNDPNAKILVYSGHDHIYKTTVNGITRMGERLAKITGLNIPAIECTMMREGFTLKQENPNFIEALKRFPTTTKPFIVIDSGNVFVDKKIKKMIDVNIFFPRTTQQFSYPNWAFKSKHKPSKFCISTENDYSFFVVYDKKEFEQVKTSAIPIFQSTIKNTDHLCLPLKRNNCVVIFK